MKLCFKIFFALYLFMGGVFFVYAQDMIVLKDGTIIDAKVTEISQTEIRYKRFNNQSGPTYVIPVADVLSIRYENGLTEIINERTATAPSTAVTAAPAAAPTAAAPPPAGSGAVQIMLPAELVSVLNMMPAIAILGNNLKFEFRTDAWLTTVNGANFSRGTIKLEYTEEGLLLKLQQTHIWPGAAAQTTGRLAGRIPGAGAVGGALTTAGSIAGTVVGEVEAPGLEIILEYKAGPPVSLRLVSTGNTEEESITQTASRPARERPPRELGDNSPLYKILGFSIGSSYPASPDIIIAVHGTISLTRNMFLGLGLDAGFGSLWSDIDSYYSFYPYVRLGFFLPFKNKGGWHSGVGIGYMIGEYGLMGVKVPQSVFAVDLEITGFNIGNVFDISYSIRTDFAVLTHKLTAGYVFRFN